MRSSTILVLSHTLLLFNLISCENSLIYTDICYDDLGCFTTRPPFSTSFARPIALLPDKPEKIDTQFFLYNRNNPSKPRRLQYSMTDAGFNGNLETKFIIHGFIDNGFLKWVLDMKDALLALDDFNVIVVDWSRTNQFPYTQATANTQVVGAEIARLINSLSRNNGLRAERVHLIGHSLGSHIAGYAGKRLGNLARISGLDPAGPYFENTDPKVRLDKTDATFVDVIHTDGSPIFMIGLGLLQPLGHVDFYPNGGKEQPSCATTSDKLFSGLNNIFLGDNVTFDKAIKCNHMLAVYLYTDSILNRNCKYISYSCKNQDDFELGKCLTCVSSSDCNEMGFWANTKRDLGSLYLKTQDANEHPYCLHNYLLTVNSNSLPEQKQTSGNFTIEIEDSTRSRNIQIASANYVFRSNTTLVQLVSVPASLGSTIKSATVRFSKTTALLSSWLYQNKWSFKSIDIVSGDYQYRFKLCPEVDYVESGKSVKFRPC
jgi:pimeloyl-ACP methyl ester carboxylesterase